MITRIASLIVTIILVTALMSCSGAAVIKLRIGDLSERRKFDIPLKGIIVNDSERQGLYFGIVIPRTTPKEVLRGEFQIFTHDGILIRRWPMNDESIRMSNWAKEPDKVAYIVNFCDNVPFCNIENEPYVTVQISLARQDTVKPDEAVLWMYYVR